MAAGYVLRRHANINDVLSLKWLPVAESIESSLANTIHKAVNDKNWPSYLPVKLSEQRVRDHRSNEIVVHNVDLGDDNGSFKYLGGKCFNDLPANVKNFNKKCL